MRDFLPRYSSGEFYGGLYNGLQYKEFKKWRNLRSMKILVVNGSPKGQYSTTLHTCLYIKEMYPENEFEILNVGQSIKKYEKDFSEAREKLDWAELILFAYPVYTFIAPSQLHRFIELMKEAAGVDDAPNRIAGVDGISVGTASAGNVSAESSSEGAAHEGISSEDNACLKRLNLAGKFATQITTSKHFYDVTAHNYILENCQDMGLKFIKGLSADMDDLTKKAGQKNACDFFEFVTYCVENDVYETFPEKAPAPAHKPVNTGRNTNAFESANANDSTNESANSNENATTNATENADTALKTAGFETDVEGGNATRTERAIVNASKTLALVCDCAPEDTQLRSMIESFKAKIGCEVKEVNIHDFHFNNGCISCFSCAKSGKCIMNDGFQELLREQIQTTDGIVIAFSIKDHSMGARFKIYDDRQFCNGHRTVTMGKPFGYLVSGDLSREKNLQMIINGRAEVGGNFLAGVATDEFDTDREIDALCKRLSFALEKQYVQPSNFLGVGGMKIFRDLIWIMQGLMRADHKFYKAHNQYDFPQKKRGTMMFMYLAGAMMNNPKLRSKIGSQVNEGMIMPYKKVVEEAAKRNKA